MDKTYSAWADKQPLWPRQPRNPLITAPDIGISAEATDAPSLELVVRGRGKYGAPSGDQVGPGRLSRGSRPQSPDQQRTELSRLLLHKQGAIRFKSSRIRDISASLNQMVAQALCDGASATALSRITQLSTWTVRRNPPGVRRPAAHGGCHRPCASADLTINPRTDGLGRIEGNGGGGTPAPAGQRPASSRFWTTSNWRP